MGNNLGTATHCRNNHEYTPENTVMVWESRKDKPFRRCRSCKRRSDKRARIRKMQKILANNRT